MLAERASHVLGGFASPKTVINCFCLATPSVVRVSCNSLGCLVYNSNDISLQILDEVVGNIVVKNTANAVLVVVQRNEGVFAPSFFEDLGAVQRVGMRYTTHRLAGTNTVGVIGVGVAVEGRKLSAPIIPFSLLSVKKNSAPEGAEKTSSFIAGKSLRT